MARSGAVPGGITVAPSERAAAADSRTDSQATPGDAFNAAAAAASIETGIRPALPPVPPADDPAPPAQERQQSVAAPDVVEAPDEPDDLQPAEGRSDEATAGSAAPAAATVAPGRRQLRLPRKAVLVATSVALATLLTLAALLILLREPILAALPQALRIYAVAGLAPDPLGEGLEIRAVKSSRDRRAGEDLLLVSGVVVNISEALAPLPVLQVSLWNDDDLEVRTLLLADRPPTLQPGQEWAFNATISDPPADARRIRVGFAATPAAH